MALIENKVIGEQIIDAKVLMILAKWEKNVCEITHKHDLYYKLKYLKCKYEKVYIYLSTVLMNA